MSGLCKGQWVFFSKREVFMANDFLPSVPSEDFQQKLNSVYRLQQQGKRADGEGATVYSLCNIRDELSRGRFKTLNLTIIS